MSNEQIATIEREITRAIERGYYDEAEVKELMETIDGPLIDPELSDKLVSRVVKRMFVDGLIVADYLLDFRNVLDPPKKENDVSEFTELDEYVECA